MLKVRFATDEITLSTRFVGDFGGIDVATSTRLAGGDGVLQDDGYGEVSDSEAGVVACVVGTGRSEYSRLPQRDSVEGNFCLGCGVGDGGAEYPPSDSDSEYNDSDEASELAVSKIAHPGEA
jgi:hypothetical protein